MRITIITIIMCSFFGAATAQSLMNAGSLITIGASSIVYVRDTIVNNGTIINNGDMQVGGSWINNAQYDAGQGQITFNSDHPQIINHNDQSFSRLTISGGGEKIFLADITIENELDLTDGILVSQNDSRIVFSNDAGFTGGSDASHVRGPVYHRGAGDKIFPVGNGSAYLPVELRNIQGASAEVGIQSVELDGNPLSASPVLKAISSKRYWQLDVLSGSLAESQVILPVKDEDIVENAGEVVVAQSASLTDDFESIGQSAYNGTITNGFVTSNRAVTKNLIAIGIASGEEGLIVFNFVSPNEDQSNDFLIIGNIENFPENKFTLFNRWGDKVFEIENYDNNERTFRGKSNINGESDLVTGTYFYSIETMKDGKKLNGFLMVKN